MDKKNSKTLPELHTNYIQHEDTALKTAMLFFSNELLPYLGIHEKAVAIAPTELVHLDIQKLFQDFNLVMENGSWKHFEFQSTNEGLEGLKRFRTYEALTSYQHKVSVTTYVLFSGNIQNPMTEFTEGINTYHIVPIIMAKDNADTLLAELKKKCICGEPITKDDLVPLTLCLLMGGKTSLKERVKSAFECTRKATSVDPADIQKIEAMVYIMADKFLDSTDMDEVMEEISMTRLGQMLVNKGRMDGATEKAVEIAKSFFGLLDDAVIAEHTGLSLETIQELRLSSTQEKRHGQKTVRNDT